MYNGIICIHKTAGYTSHDVVARMRGILKQKKIGHTGTLDPEATGVLVVCLGNATKLCDMLTDRDKEYVAELRLGITTDTQDMTGNILSEKEVSCSEEQVWSVMSDFIGGYEQTPPMYSALKVNGKKLYELARSGKEVEREARPVMIYDIEMLDVKIPVVKFRTVCSKGTYIRTLCADIGANLGCGGAMQSLVRTGVGRFRLENAVTLEMLEQLRDEGRVGDVLTPVDEIFEDCPTVHVRNESGKLLENGNIIYAGQTIENRNYEDESKVRFYREDGSFAGVYAYEAAHERFRPVKMFL